MAKSFNPSQLSPADQAAFAGWQQRLQQYVQQSGGGVPAPVTYALAHPDYLQSHPELREAYNLVSGASLPSTMREALKDYHPTWNGGQAGMDKNSGLWDKWETWLQLGLGGAVGGVGIAGGLGPSAAATAGTAGTSGGAATGGTVGGLGATSSYGPLAGGYGAATTEAAVPASLAASGGTAAGIGTAAAASTQFWKKILPDIIGAGANLAGNAIQSRQVDKSVQAQIDAANRQLELQKDVYQQQRADLAPYRNLGSGASTLLSQGLGLPAAQDTTIPAFQQQAPQQAMAAPRSIASLGGGSDGMVNMLSPDGKPARVPQAQVQAAMAAGGRMA